MCSLLLFSFYGIFARISSTSRLRVTDTRYRARSALALFLDRSRAVFRKIASDVNEPSILNNTVFRVWSRRGGCFRRCLRQRRAWPHTFSLKDDRLHVQRNYWPITNNLFREYYWRKEIRESKLPHDLPLAIVRTFFAAIFHDVSATVRSYFNCDSHHLFYDTKIDSDNYFSQSQINYR